MKNTSILYEVANLVTDIDDQRLSRMILGAFALNGGRGATSQIAEITSMHRGTIAAGKNDFLVFLQAKATAKVLASAIYKEAASIAENARSYSEAHEVAKSTALYIAKTAASLIVKAALAGISQYVGDSELLSAGQALIEGSIATIPKAVSQAVNSGFGASMSRSTVTGIAETAARSVIAAAEQLLESTVSFVQQSCQTIDDLFAILNKSLADQIVQSAYLTPKQALPPSQPCENLPALITERLPAPVNFDSTYNPKNQSQKINTTVEKQLTLSNEEHRPAITVSDNADTHSTSYDQNIKISYNHKSHNSVDSVHNDNLRSKSKKLSKKKINISKDSKRQRKKGGGAKKLEEKQPKIIEDLQRLVNKDSYGDPQNPLRYKSKSLRKIARELKNFGYDVSYGTVRRLLKKLGYSLQENKKLIQVGEDHPDRDQQFEFINNVNDLAYDQNQVVISIDSKKKEKIGNFSQDGREYAEKGQGIKTNDHDFSNISLTSYGIYEPFTKKGFFNLGTSADTPAYAINSIGFWLNNSIENFKNVSIICIKADGGGSNSSRSHMFKLGLQQLADEYNIAFLTTHYTPGCSKWNPIEHKLFSFVSKNWRARPIDSVETANNLILNTESKTISSIKTNIDTHIYTTGGKVDKTEYDNINIYRCDFHGEWNYLIMPHEKNIKYYEQFLEKLPYNFNKKL